MNQDHVAPCVRASDGSGSGFSLQLDFGGGVDDAEAAREIELSTKQQASAVERVNAAMSNKTLGTRV